MRRSRLEVIKKDIFELFENQDIKVFKLAQLDEILMSQRDLWRLPNSTTLSRFIDFLMKQGKLQEQRFNFKFRPITLFFWGSVTVNEVAMSFRPQGYLSHLSAIQFHELSTIGNVKLVYVNDEQSPKPRGQGRLEQSQIDAVFQRQPRRSNSKVTIGEFTFYLLSGKHTNCLGVIEQEDPTVPVPIRVTCLERTLIDAVVRTTYSGGVHTVLEAYRRASDKLNISVLIDLLQQLDYIYPYHQAIGFYLQRSKAYDSSVIDRFKAIPQNFDFYLDYEMAYTNYSPEWRLHYPSYLD